MILIGYTLLEVFAIFSVFWSLRVSLTAFTLIFLSLCVAIFLVKRLPVEPPPNLLIDGDPLMKWMFDKFGHYYTYPRLCDQLSGASSGLSIAALIVGLIITFKFVWWGFFAAFLVGCLGGFLSRTFNPSRFLVDDQERFLHNQIIRCLS